MLPREPLCTNPGSGLYRLPVLGFECTVPNGVCGLLVELGLYLEGRWTEPEECGGADSEGADRAVLPAGSVPDVLEYGMCRGSALEYW